MGSGIFSYLDIFSGTIPQGSDTAAEYQTLFNNSSTSAVTGTDVTAGSFVTGTTYTIKTPGDTTFTTIGAADNVAGTVFVATGQGSGTGIATEADTLADCLRMPSVREFPSIGTPSNIVNVPVYGQKTSSQIQGQSDAPTLEVTVNYVADDLTELYELIGSKSVFRFSMADSALTVSEVNGATISAGNTMFFFEGKVEAILVNPALTDSSTATITLSSQSDFQGPFTVDAT